MVSLITFSDALVHLWPWLFPATYVVHIVEEYWGGGGFSEYSARAKGIHFSPRRFLLLTGLGGVLIVAGIVIAQNLKFPQLLLVILGTIVLLNGLSHSISSVLKAEYNPGLISGIVLWIPLGAATLFLLQETMTGRRYATAVLGGVAIHVIVSWLALRGEKVQKI